MCLLFSFSSVAPALADRSTTNEFVVWSQIDRRVLHRLEDVVPVNVAGAVGNNRDSFLQVGLQDQSSWIMPEALVTHDTALLDRALRIIEYGFAHQNASGDFEWHAGSSGSAPTALSRAQSAAFFLADVGESLSLLRLSPWFERSEETASLRSRATMMESQVRLALTWLVGQHTLLETDTTAVNRTFVYALAFRLPAQLVTSQAASDVGDAFARNAIDRQRPDGTFPEAGGYDSSYQGVSLFLASIFYVERKDGGTLRDDLWSAIGRGLAREEPSITEDGTVATVGNSRIGSNGERLFGETKSVDGRAVTLGLLFYAKLNQDQALDRKAMTVAHHYHVDGT